jgi:predicted DNA binding CopG/RHH family protein
MNKESYSNAEDKLLKMLTKEIFEETRLLLIKNFDSLEEDKELAEHLIKDLEVTLKRDYKDAPYFSIRT